MIAPAPFATDAGEVAAAALEAPDGDQKAEARFLVGPVRPHFAREDFLEQAETVVEARKVKR